MSLSTLCHEAMVSFCLVVDKDYLLVLLFAVRLSV
jgi:hypothetical protein